MKFILLVIGRTTDKHMQVLIDDYASRISHYVPFAIEVVPELRQTKALSIDQQKAAEGVYTHG